jgi:hypothetical protein
VKKGLLALAFLAAAACGGGSSPSSAATQTLVTASSAPTTAATNPPTAVASTARPFADIVGASATTSYKVTYTTTYTTTASTPGLGGVQTWYVSGKKFRMDLATGAGGAAALSIYALPEGNFMCINTGAGAQCTNVGSADATAKSPAAGIQEQIRTNPAALSGTFKENRTILGTAVACYVTSGATPGTICYTNAGVPLYFQMQSSGATITMEATAVGVPTDADFTLPQ